MKKNKKYNYVQATRSTDQGTRTYDVDGTKLPSVTTILAQTKDQSYLDRWKARIGHEEAERIKNLSSKRGTSMHKFIEKHITGVGYDDLTKIGKQAKPMAQKIIDIGLTPVSEYYGSEVSLYYPGLYAGSTDLVCMHNGKETIADFKQANKPKREEWIEDYKLQIAAYSMCHDYVHGSNIEQGVIMICTPDLYFQEFRFEGDEMRRYRHKFLERLSQYYKIKNIDNNGS
jgi:genome maintenance exonuclease 1